MTHFYDSSVLGVHYLHVLGSNSSAQRNSHYELPSLLFLMGDPLSRLLMVHILYLRVNPVFICTLDT
jgi:hypothetical protein